MRPCPWEGTLGTLLLLTLLCNAALAVERHYYIAAVNIDWDYTSPGHQRSGPTYKKAVYREYEDATFKKAKPHPSSLGLLGPTLRGQKGDVIVVTFRNMVDWPCNIHTHGIAYGKQSEGALYFDNTSQKEKEDDVVHAGGSHTYTWEVTSEVVPAAADPPCLTYTYLSHVDIVKDYNSGLIGTLLICKPDSLDDSGEQKHFHQESILLFGIFDESLSFYDKGTLSSAEHTKYTINGYVNGSVPGLNVCAYSSVSWHLLGMSSAPELFSIHFNGQVLTQNGHRVSSVGIISGTTTSATMTAVHAGRWLVSSYITKHLEAGMHGFLTVKTCKDFNKPLRQLTIQQKRDSQMWTYYIAAEEVIWDYTPNMPDYIDTDFRSKYLKQGPHRIGKKYKKAVFTQFTDQTFTVRAENKQRKMELGIIGPVIRAQIRDQIRIVFKNKASRPYSIYPHGLTIDKAGEGATYPEGGNQTQAVQPGETHTYVWNVVDEDEPLPDDPRCLTRMYHSAVNTPYDIASGLVGPLLICKSQSLNKRNVQLKADKEQHAMFAIFDENKSWYLDENIRNFCSDPERVRKDAPDFYASNVMHTINGYMYESGQVLGFCNGEFVTWHVSSVGEQNRIQTATFYGHTFELNDREEDMLTLFPMTGESISMAMDSKGDWLLSSLNSHDTTQGMRIKFKDVECIRDYVYEYEDADAEKFNMWTATKEVQPEKKNAEVSPPKKAVPDEETDQWAELLGIRSHKKSDKTSHNNGMELLDLSRFDYLDLPLPSKNRTRQNLDHSKKMKNDSSSEPRAPSQVDEEFSASKFMVNSTTTGPWNGSVSVNASQEQTSRLSSLNETKGDSTNSTTVIFNNTSFTTALPSLADPSEPPVPVEVTDNPVTSANSTVNKTENSHTYRNNTPDSSDTQTNIRDYVYEYVDADAEFPHKEGSWHVPDKETDQWAKLLGIQSHKKSDVTDNPVTSANSTVNKTENGHTYSNNTSDSSDTQTNIRDYVYEYVDADAEKFTKWTATENVQPENKNAEVSPPKKAVPDKETDQWAELLGIRSHKKSDKTSHNNGMELLDLSRFDYLDLPLPSKKSTRQNLDHLKKMKSDSSSEPRAPSQVDVEFSASKFVVNSTTAAPWNGSVSVNASQEQTSRLSSLNETKGDSTNSTTVIFNNTSLTTALPSLADPSEPPVPVEVTDNPVTSANSTVNKTENGHTYSNNTSDSSDTQTNITAGPKHNESLSLSTESYDIASQESDKWNSSEEVVIYVGHNQSAGIKTNSLGHRREHWSYEGKQEPVPMAIPEDMTKYIQNETKPKKKVVHRRVHPFKGHAMKTRKRKEYKPQPRSGLNARGFQPRGARPISNEEDILNKPIVIGIPRPDFKDFMDYDLYTMPDDYQEKDLSKEEYEYVHYKDPYSQAVYEQDMTMDETTAYFLKHVAKGTHVRQYFLSAEEVDWDYGGYGQRRSDMESDYQRPTKFTKVVYRGYLDPKFKIPDIRGEVDEHLGILGPVIRAEVGDTIMVVFRNLGSRPFSIHANGVSYSKQMEGLNYMDGTPYWYQEDNAVRTNQTYTYMWKVSTKVGPKDDEPDCRTWAYYSGVNPERDIHSGLIGPLLICRKGTLSTKPVDTREFVLLFMTFDENKSWYYDKNYEMIERKSKRMVLDPLFKEKIKFPAINGIIYALKGLRMYTNQLANWHVFNMGAADDVHSIHFHGQTFLSHQNKLHRQGIYPLLPGGFATLQMWPSKPGLWLLESVAGFTQKGGMQTLFLVIDNECGLPLGLMSGSVEDKQIVASQTRGYWEPHLARLHSSGKYNAWSANDVASWIQVDFQRPVVISKVATQGAKEMLYSNFVMNFSISYSTDRKKWVFYKGDSDTLRKYFKGNEGAHEVKENLFFPPIVGRFVRLYPLQSYGKPTVRMEYYGCELDGCSVPLGMKSGDIRDQQIKASSTESNWYIGTWEAWLARLDRQGTINAWQAKHNDMNQWLQIELKDVKKITGIITQGAKSLGTKMFVSAFILEYSKDGIRWTKYTDDPDYEVKEFEGNTDNNDHKRNYIYPPIFTKYIRIVPRRWQKSITMRVELLGCDFE